MHTAILETSDLFGRLAESGVVGLCLAAVMYWIVAPLLRNMFRQQQLALEMLRNAIDALQNAVSAFRDFEREERETHDALIRTQEQILSKLDR